MASLSNQYYVIDDTAPTAGLAGTPGAGASGQPISPTFTASTIANALITAYLICTALQRPGRLVALGGNPPWTSVAAGAAAIALTAAPSGTGY